MKSRQPYGDIQVIKDYTENRLSQHLYKSSHNIGVENVNYHWKVFRWIIQGTIIFLDK